KSFGTLLIFLGRPGSSAAPPGPCARDAATKDVANASRSRMDRVTVYTSLENGASHDEVQAGNEAVPFEAKIPPPDRTGKPDGRPQPPRCGCPRPPRTRHALRPGGAGPARLPPSPPRRSSTSPEAAPAERDGRIYQRLTRGPGPARRRSGPS